MCWASVVERAMELYFLHIHEIRQDPRKKQALLVLFLSVIYQTKSELVWAHRLKCDCLWCNRPKLVVCFTYLMIFFTTLKWDSMGIGLKPSIQEYTKHDSYPTCGEVEKAPNHTPIESLINWSLVCILIKLESSAYRYLGVFSIFQYKFLDELNLYLDWLIKFSSFDCLIWRPRKKFNSPIMLILNSLPMREANSP